MPRLGDPPYAWRNEISSRRSKADRSDKPAAVPFNPRPFVGRVDETEWVALREIVPAATAELSIAGEGRPVTLSTVLPAQWAGMVRADGKAFLGLQVPSRSGDAARDLGWALEQVLAGEPGTSVVPVQLPGPGATIDDLLTEAPLEVTLHQGFDYWVDGAVELDEEAALSMEKANASVVPTERVTSVTSAYWCRMRERGHLRWVLPEDEAPLLDAMARLAASPAGLGLGDGTRYVGSFRALGLLCPVWDLPVDMPAEALEEPTVAWRARLDEALTVTGLTADQRRARSGLLSRQVTLR